MLHMHNFLLMHGMHVSRTRTRSCVKRESDVALPRSPPRITRSCCRSVLCTWANVSHRNGLDWSGFSFSFSSSGSSKLVFVASWDGLQPVFWTTCPRCIMQFIKTVGDSKACFSGFFKAEPKHWPMQEICFVDFLYSRMPSTLVSSARRWASIQIAAMCVIVRAWRCGYHPAVLSQGRSNAIYITT